MFQRLKDRSEMITSGGSAWVHALVRGQFQGIYTHRLIRSAREGLVRSGPDAIVRDLLAEGAAGELAFRQRRWQLESRCVRKSHDCARLWSHRRPDRARSARGQAHPEMPRLSLFVRRQVGGGHSIRLTSFPERSYVEPEASECVADGLLQTIRAVTRLRERIGHLLLPVATARDRSSPSTHRLSKPLPSLLDSSSLPFSQMPKSGRSGRAVRRTHPRVPNLISCTLGLSDDMMLRVQHSGLPCPNSTIFAALNAAIPIHGSTTCLA